MLYADPRNPDAARLADQLRTRLPDLEEAADVSVVIGGDGFMLHTVATHGRDSVYVGLNAGRIGFLLNDITSLDDVVDKLRRRAWTSYAFPLLRADVRYADGTSTVERAINDFAVERSTGQTAHLRIHVGEHVIVDRLVADGVVISTALGSTAYTFSAGGPACHPTLPVMALTAISPHHPRLAPILLPVDAEIRVEALDVQKRPVRAVADGRTQDGVVGATVRHAREEVRFAWFEGHDLTMRMVRKIIHP
jgi:NAD+ kinase